MLRRAERSELNLNSGCCETEQAQAARRTRIGEEGRAGAYDRVAPHAPRFGLRIQRRVTQYFHSYFTRLRQGSHRKLQPRWEIEAGTVDVLFWRGNGEDAALEGHVAQLTRHKVALWKQKDRRASLCSRQRRAEVQHGELFAIRVRVHPSSEFGRLCRDFHYTSSSQMKPVRLG